MSKDSKFNALPLGGLESIVSHEAAKACLRLGPRTEEERRRLIEHIEKLEDLQIGTVTPILITPPGFLYVSQAIPLTLKDWAVN